MTFHKYMPYEIVGQFPTSNETRSKSHFEPYLREIEADHSVIEKRFVYALNNYTVLVPTMINIGKIQLACILLL